MAHSLEGCVSSLRETIGLLGASISTLDAGVTDFPRLSKVLQTTRHFELLSESTLQAAQSSLMEEIVPEVDNLLSTISKNIDKLARREQSLIAKYELNQGRLDQNDAASARMPMRLRGTSQGAGNALQAMKAQQLRQKKERLHFAIERLQLQAGQKERQLRKSMAAQPSVAVDDDDGF